MGIFSMYTGLIYNDFFSKSLNLFGGSAWQINYNTSTIIENDYLVLDPSNGQWLNDTYPIGVDPIWQVAGNNKIIFQNSFKMKLSIIFGVLHMMLGMLLSLCNHYHVRDKWTMVTVFAPQMAFLVVLFGYLAALIFIKWMKFSASNPIPYNSECAPSILLTFIDMVLFKSPPPSSKAIDANRIPGCDAYMFDSQYEMQSVFMMAAMICIPWMAFAKPLLALFNRTRAHRMDRKRIAHGDVEGGSKQQEDDTTTATATASAIENPNYFDSHNDHTKHMAEVFIASGIQTIEFVLGSISHTASYLRLWALSLAHACLTEMLWNLVLRTAWRINGHFYAGTLLSIIFAVWCALTLGILILMEGLSAFLHTLRLHWVEFQSKFYNGQGRAFQPFSFQRIHKLSNDALLAE